MLTHSVIYKAKLENYIKKYQITGPLAVIPEILYSSIHTFDKSDPDAIMNHYQKVLDATRIPISWKMGVRYPIHKPMRRDILGTTMLFTLSVLLEAMLASLKNDNPEHNLIADPTQFPVIRILNDLGDRFEEYRKGLSRELKGWLTVVIVILTNCMIPGDSILWTGLTDICVAEEAPDLLNFVQDREVAINKKLEERQYTAELLLQGTSTLTNGPESTGVEIGEKCMFESTGDSFVTDKYTYNITIIAERFKSLTFAEIVDRCLMMTKDRLAMKLPVDIDPDDIDFSLKGHQPQVDQLRADSAKFFKMTSVFNGDDPDDNGKTVVETDDGCFLLFTITNDPAVYGFDIDAYSKLLRIEGNGLESEGFDILADITAGGDE